eukprot:134882_1
MTDSSAAELFIPIYILTGFYCLILTPLSLLYIYRLWQLASCNISFFTKRHPKLIVITGTLCNIYPTVLRPIADLTRAHGVFDFEHVLPRTIVNIIQWYMLLQYMRLWLLYYDYQYSLNTLSLKWKQQILKEETSLPWTHRHKWLGNVKILSIVTFVLGALFIIIILHNSVMHKRYVYVTQFVPMISTMFMFVIAFKVRKCRDEFMVQKEFKIFGISLFFAIAAYIAIGIVSIAGSALETILFNMFTSTCCYIMAFVSTHWVITQYHAQQTGFKRELAVQLSTRSVINKVKGRPSLEDVLSTKDGFDLFANHLVREFSIENLFFVFEMVQIKNELVNNRLIDVDDIGVVIAIDFERMKHVRRKDSHIHSVEEMIANIEYIVMQYVEMEGDYTVNVSARARNKLLHEYERLGRDNGNNNTETNGKAKVKEFIRMFDECMEEIIALMAGDSLTRFYDTAEYKMLIDSK